MEIFTIGPGAVVKYILYSWPCAPGKSNTCSRITSPFISYKTIVFCTRMNWPKLGTRTYRTTQEVKEGQKEIHGHRQGERGSVRNMGKGGDVIGRWQRCRALNR